MITLTITGETFEDMWMQLGEAVPTLNPALSAPALNAPDTDAPAPEKPRRGRPPGAKNKPEAPEAKAPEAKAPTPAAPAEAPTPITKAQVISAGAAFMKARTAALVSQGQDPKTADAAATAEIKAILAKFNAEGFRTLAPEHYSAAIAALTPPPASGTGVFDE